MSDRRERIMEAAREMFAGSGYKTTSIQQIADACDISKGAFYLHFRSKDELLIAIIEQIEEESNEHINELRRNTSLTAREKLRAQIQYQIDSMFENKDLSQVFMQETGLSLNEELLMFIRKCRFNWQTTQENFLLDVYGPCLEPFLIDAAIAINGVLNEYYSILLLEDVDVDIQYLTDYLIHFVDHMTAGLMKCELKPVFTPEMMPSRRQLEEEIARSSVVKAKEGFETLKEQLEQLTGESSQHQDLQASMDLIGTELDKEEPNKVLIQGMLANLGQLDVLEKGRAIIARELDIKLL